MPAALIRLRDLKNHLGLTGTKQDTILRIILDGTEALLEGQVGFSFAESATITDEPHDGTGRPFLYADLPVQSLTTAKVGPDPTDPNVSLLDVADITVIPGQPRLLRQGGAAWPEGDTNVWLTYVAATTVYDDAKVAVLQVASQVWNAKGQEHVASERLADHAVTFREDIGRAAEVNPKWQAFVSTRMRPRLG